LPWILQPFAVDSNVPFAFPMALLEQGWHEDRADVAGPAGN